MKSAKGLSSTTDSETVLQYLHETEQQIAELERLWRSDKIRNLPLSYCKAIFEVAQDARKRLAKGANCYSELIKLSRLLVALQWKFFVGFKPFVVDREKRAAATRRAATAKAEQRELRRSYCRYLLSRHPRKRIPTAIKAIKQNWKDSIVGSPFNERGLPEKAPADRSLRRYIAHLYPKQLSRDPRSFIAVSAYTLPPRWNDAVAFRAAQNIKINEPEHFKFSPSPEERRPKHGPFPPRNF